MMLRFNMTYATKWHIVSVNLILLIFWISKNIFLKIWHNKTTHLFAIYMTYLCTFSFLVLFIFPSISKQKMVGQFISTEIVIRNSEQCNEWKSVIPANEFFPLSNMKYCDVGLSDRVRIDYFNRNVSYLDFDEVQYFLQYRKSITPFKINFVQLFMNEHLTSLKVHEW